MRVECGDCPCNLLVDAMLQDSVTGGELDIWKIIAGFCPNRALVHRGM